MADRTWIAVYGGRGDPLPCGGAEVALFPSARFGGHGDVRRLEAALNGGAVDGLVLWARFAGHSDGARLVSAARRAGVPVRIVCGGRTSLRRAVQALARGGR